MQRSNANLREMVQTAVVAAIIFALALFLPIVAYPKFGLVEITTLMIPVIVGAIAIGPRAGAILGCCFGITSFLQCIGIPALSPFGALVMAESPFFCVVMCIGTRTLAGFLCGVIYKDLKQRKFGDFWKHLIASACGSLMNTLFFMIALICFFRNAEFVKTLMANMGVETIFTFVIALVGINGVIEVVACSIIATAVSMALARAVRRG